MDEELLYTIIWIIIGGILSIIAFELLWDFIQMNIREVLYNTLMYILDTFEHVGTLTLSPGGQERMNPMYAWCRFIINIGFSVGEFLPGGLGGFGLNRYLSSRK